MACDRALAASPRCATGIRAGSSGALTSDAVTTPVPASAATATATATTGTEDSVPLLGAARYPGRGRFLRTRWRLAMGSSLRGDTEPR